MQTSSQYPLPASTAHPFAFQPWGSDAPRLLTLRDLLPCHFPGLQDALQNWVHRYGIWRDPCYLLLAEKLRGVQPGALLALPDVNLVLFTPEDKILYIGNARAQIGGACLHAGSGLIHGPRSIYCGACILRDAVPLE